MNTTSTPSSGPTTAPTAAAHGAPAPRAPGGPGAPLDLFASLLALVADAPALAPDTSVPTSASAVAAAPEEADDPAADPLAALMAWVQPGLASMPAPTGTADTAAAASGSALPAAGTDIAPLAAETRRIDGAGERPGAIELPAAAAAGARAAAPAWLTGALRTGQALPDKAGTAAGSDINLRWQRGASAEHASPTGLAMRSTVTLGERIAAGGPPPWAAALRDAATDDALPGASPVHGARTGSDGLAVAAPGAGSGTGADAGSGDSAAADSGQHDRGTDPTDPATEGLWRDEAAEDAVEVSHWGSGQLRNASLRVGEAGEQAIDIQLSLRGDEVQVAFRTDDEQARDLLRQQADRSLGELLQDSGMQLGGVSVGAQGQPSSGHEAAPRSTVAHAAARRASDEPAATPAPAARTRADGGPALDLFI